MLERKNKKKEPDSYFLKLQSKFSAKKTLNTKLLKIVGVLFVIGVIGFLFLTGSDSNDIKKETSNEYKTSIDQSKKAVESLPNQSLQQNLFMAPGFLTGGQLKTSTGSTPKRQYTASQIVRREENDLGGAASLTLSTTIPAKLVNTVISTDSVSPVISEITEDALDTSSSSVIPQGTRAIGQASFDNVTRRLQVRFHALVYPSGEQKSFSGLALLSDGSAGLEGEYHSRVLTRQTGKFLGTFASGFAEGMKDKEAGPMGQTIERGSVKNGVLNGLSASMLSQARDTSQDLEGERPYVEVSKGTTFLIYLDKEFSP